MKWRQAPQSTFTQSEQPSNARATATAEPGEDLIPIQTLFRITTDYECWFCLLPHGARGHEHSRTLILLQWRAVNMIMEARLTIANPIAGALPQGNTHVPNMPDLHNVRRHRMGTSRGRRFGVEFSKDRY